MQSSPPLHQLSHPCSLHCASGENEETEGTDGESKGERDKGWSDWDDMHDEPTMCLFDHTMAPTPESLITEHLISAHNFDLKAMAEQGGLDFYSLMKLVNYIRRQTSLHVCYLCLGLPYASEAALTEHFATSRHGSTLPDASIWSSPQYLLPTFEDDPLLRVLDTCLPQEEDEDDDDDKQGANERVTEP